MTQHPHHPPHPLTQPDGASPGLADHATAAGRSQRKRARAEREAATAAAERARLEVGPGGGPESAAGYEQQLMASPASSFIWIKYMAFQLKLGEYWYITGWQSPLQAGMMEWTGSVLCGGCSCGVWQRWSGHH